METVIARIDEWLKTACAERSTFGRQEVVDMLLDLRLAATSTLELLTV